LRNPLKTKGIRLLDCLDFVRLSKTTTLMLLKPKPLPMETEHQNQIGDSATAQTFTHPGPLDIIRTETVLSKLPVHNLSKKGRVNIQIIKQAPDGNVELKWEVSYSDRYGQARALAYKLDTIVIDQRIEEAGRPLPVRVCLGSLNQVAEELGLQSDHGTTNLHIKKALRQNALAGITAKFKYKANDGTERILEATFTRYSVFFTGEKFSDGTRADAVYIELNPTYREVLNNAPIRPLDLAYKKLLPPAAQRFYEIVSYKIFTAIKYNQPAKLSYSEYCTFSAQQRYLNRAQAQKQMYKIHEVHKKSGYITSVRYEETADELGQPDWIMRYTPGPKAIAEYATFSGKRSRTIDAASTVAALPAKARESNPPPAHRPRQRRLKLSAPPETPAIPAGVVDYRMVHELGKRGVGEIDARQLLGSLKPGQPVLDQLEWGDLQIDQAKGKITNPPGFYISLLQRDVPLPSNFESSQAKNARLKAEFKQQQAFLERQHSQIQAEREQEEKLDAQIAALPDAAQAALLKQAKAGLLAQHPNMAHYFKTHPEAEQDGALRARMRNLLRDGWTHQSPESNQATNPPVRQADRLQQPGPQAEQGSQPPVAEQPQPEESPDVDRAEGLRRQYDAFCRQQAQGFLDSLDMMERGRRLRAARLFLLNQHPQKDYHHQLVTDEKYEEFHSLSHDRLIEVTIASLGLPDFTAWQAGRQGQN